MQFAHQRTGSISACAGVVCNPAIPFEAPVTLFHQHNLDWFGTVRGRLGATITPYAVAYVTGGLAYGEVEHVGTIYGTISIGSGLGSAFGSWSGGLIHDATHGYNALLAFAQSPLLFVILSGTATVETGEMFAGLDRYTLGDWRRGGLA